MSVCYMMMIVCYNDCLLWWLSAMSTDECLKWRLSAWYDDDCLLYDCLLYDCLLYDCLLWWWLSAIWLSGVDSYLIAALMSVCWVCYDYDCLLWRVSDMKILLWWWLSAMMMTVCYDCLLYNCLLYKCLLWWLSACQFVGCIPSASPLLLSPKTSEQSRPADPTNERRDLWHHSPLIGRGLCKRPNSLSYSVLLFKYLP